MAVSISSNSEQKIQDALLQVNYPFGFNFKSANPSPDFGNNTWRLGDLNPKSKKVIDIKGVIEGQDNEDKIFTFNAGLADPNDERSMGVGIISSMQKITLKQPFVGLDIKINGDSGKDFVTKIGNKMNAEIAISNNLPVAVNNANVKVSLSGNILNKSSVNASNGGFYRSSDNTISWDKNGESILSLLSPGQNSSLSFNFMTLPYSSNMISAFHNAEVDIDVTLKGDVKSDSLPSQIVSTFSKKIKISTDLTLNPRLLYSVGAFKNTGPIPPKADIQTTYTVDWIVTNSFNDVSGAVVKATLPPYVTWLGSYSPQSEKISYNPDNRTVTWELGNIPSGAGFSGSSREVGFQVGVTPSQNQIGSAPVVINETTISGTDNFTGQSAGATKASLNTRISTDPKYNYGDEKVNP
jgi:hypothetical protein